MEKNTQIETLSEQKHTETMFDWYNCKPPHNQSINQSIKLFFPFIIIYINHKRFLQTVLSWVTSVHMITVNSHFSV